MTRDRLREVVVAGYDGDGTTARAALGDDDPAVRALALGALDRIGALTDHDVRAAFGDHAPVVRRRAVELAALRTSVDLIEPLHDPEPGIVEVAAWACGEHVDVSDAELSRLVELAGTAEAALVREAAVAALGAIGDVRGLPAILAGCQDVPTVRRRAVLALAPFEGDTVEQALDAALEDRDWQVRQAAEDLRRAAGGQH